MSKPEILFIAACAMTITGVANATTCDELYGRDSYGHVETVASKVTIPMTSETLVVEPSKNGGVTVEGTARGGAYEVTICRTAWRNEWSRSKPLGDPNAISIEASPSRLAASEELGGWNVSFIIAAPPQARMSISTHNGPISISHASGTFEVEAQNGPLSLDGVSGEVVARLQNGPIRFDDLTGQFDLETRNGPLSVDLSDGQWSGARVRATTQNGPVKLRLTRAIPAGIQVSSSGWGKIHCPVELCGTIESDERTGRQYPRSFSFGPATQDLVMKTTNGPLTISLD